VTTIASAAFSGFGLELIELNPLRHIRHGVRRQVVVRVIRFDLGARTPAPAPTPTGSKLLLVLVFFRLRSKDGLVVVLFRLENAASLRGKFRSPPLLVVRRIRFVVHVFVAGEQALRLTLRFGPRLAAAVRTLRILPSDAFERWSAVLQPFLDGLLVPLAQSKHAGLDPHQGVVFVALFGQRSQTRSHGDFGALAHVTEEVLLDRYVCYLFIV